MAADDPVVAGHQQHHHRQRDTHPLGGSAPAPAVTAATSSARATDVGYSSFRKTL